MKDAGEPWSTTAATLLTWELSALITWLRTVATVPDILPERWIGLERIISFAAYRSGHGLAVWAHLNWLFLPPERYDGAYHVDEDTIVAFVPNADELRRPADELEQELHVFPERIQPPAYRLTGVTDRLCAPGPGEMSSWAAHER